jgi:hypothetical protein
MDERLVHAVCIVHFFGSFSAALPPPIPPPRAGAVPAPAPALVPIPAARRRRSARYGYSLQELYLEPIPCLSRPTKRSSQMNDLAVIFEYNRQISKSEAAAAIYCITHAACMIVGSPPFVQCGRQHKEVERYRPKIPGTTIHRLSCCAA